jgi:C-terminal processing protease CtpA/Prc
MADKPKEEKPDYEKFAKEHEHVYDLTDTIKHHAKIANVNLINDLLTDKETGMVKYDRLKDKDTRKKVLEYLKNQFNDLLKTKMKTDLSKVDPIVANQIANSVYGFDEYEMKKLLDEHKENFTHKFEEFINEKTEKNYENYGQMIIDKYDFKKEHLKEILEKAPEPLKYIHGKLDYSTFGDKEAKQMVANYHNKKGTTAGKVQYFEKVLEQYGKKAA